MEIALHILRGLAIGIWLIVCLLAAVVIWTLIQEKQKRKGEIAAIKEFLALVAPERVREFRPTRRLGGVVQIGDFWMHWNIWISRHSMSAMNYKIYKKRSDEEKVEVEPLCLVVPSKLPAGDRAIVVYRWLRARPQEAYAIAKSVGQRILERN